MRHLLLLAIPWTSVALLACSGDDGGGAANPPPSDGGFSDSSDDTSQEASPEASPDQFVPPDGDGCVTGEPCGDGGICTGNTCCSAEKACGDACCEGSQVCSFQVCVTPGDDCIDSTESTPPRTRCGSGVTTPRRRAGSSSCGSPSTSTARSTRRSAHRVPQGPHAEAAPPPSRTSTETGSRTSRSRVVSATPFSTGPSSWTPLSPAPTPFFG